MSKKVRYKAIRENELLDISVALVQASSLLDLVAKKALVTGDDKTMLEVADRWIAIATLFAIPSEEPADEAVNTNNNIQQYGFSYEKEQEVIEDDD